MHFSVSQEHFHTCQLLQCNSGLQFSEALTTESAASVLLKFVIFSGLMSQSGHVILSVQQGFTCSFHLNGIRATHGDSVSACPTYGHFKMKPPRSLGVRVPSCNTL